LKRTEVIQRLLWEYDELSKQDIESLIAGLDRKIVRWLAINHPDNRTRKAFFRATGVRIGVGAVINSNVMISDGYKNLVTIGARASISPGVTIVADAGPNNSALRNNPYVREHLIVEQEVVIGDDAWLGAGAIILPGVNIGAHAVVGAGAVVARSVPRFTIVAGVPARPVRDLNAADADRSTDGV